MPEALRYIVLGHEGSRRTNALLIDLRTYSCTDGEVKCNRRWDGTGHFAQRQKDHWTIALVFAESGTPPSESLYSLSLSTFGAAKMLTWMKTFKPQKKWCEKSKKTIVPATVDTGRELWYDVHILNELLCDRGVALNMLSG